jgi:hypothetical protein
MTPEAASAPGQHALIVGARRVDHAGMDDRCSARVAADDRQAARARGAGSLASSFLAELAGEIPKHAGHRVPGERGGRRPRCRHTRLRPDGRGSGTRRASLRPGLLRYGAGLCSGSRLRGRAGSVRRPRCLPSDLAADARPSRRGCWTRRGSRSRAIRTRPGTGARCHLAATRPEPPAPEFGQISEIVDGQVPAHAGRLTGGGPLDQPTLARSPYASQGYTSRFSSRIRYRPDTAPVEQGAPCRFGPSSVKPKR